MNPSWSGGGNPLHERNRMVDVQLARRGITDARVLDAFRSIPREAFIPENLVAHAYEDAPLPIGEGQTISQPYIVALTLQALQLRAEERVLEIGTGSGYAAALLGRLAAEVYTVERHPVLADEARARLKRLGFLNVHVHCGDGTLGWPDHAPFHAIAVAAGAPSIPRALLAQLTSGGRLVIPVGGARSSQSLVRLTRGEAGDFVEEEVAEVRFVPLIGEQGWPNESDPGGAP